MAVGRVSCFSVVTKTILFSEDSIYCHFCKEKTLRFNLGRPSRSDLVLFRLNVARGLIFIV